MRIGVISDTHIPDRAKEIPKKALQEFKKVDMVIHAGDLVSMYVLDELNTVCKNVKAVHGNMDPEDVRKSLPEKQIIKIGKYTIGLTHGFGAPKNLIENLTPYFKDDKVDVIIFGHSHNPVNETKGGILFFNPGSATDKIFSEYNSFGIIEINGGINAKIIRI